MTTVVPCQLADATGIIHNDADVVSRHAQKNAMHQRFRVHGVERLSDRAGYHFLLDTSALKALPDKGCCVILKAHPAERLLERLRGGFHAMVVHHPGAGDDHDT